jgi:fibronectin-binding autotransporter adhesin
MEMRKRKALALVAVSAIAAGAKIGLAQNVLFTTQGDFGGSAAVIPSIDNGYYGFVGGNASDPSLGGGTLATPATPSAAVNPTAASLAAGQETGWEGMGYYDGAGNILHVDADGNNDSAFGALGLDSQGNDITYNGFSLGNAGGTVNGLGHYANDFAATLYPTAPNATTSPTGPFNTGGTDPNFGKSYAGNTGVSGSITVQGYSGKSEGEGYDVVDTGEMVSNSTASSAFLHALGTGVTMAIDFTAPGGGTTLTSDGKIASPYYLMAFGTYDSNGGLNANGAGAGWINPSSTLTAKDAGSYSDDAGSFVVTHGSGASSYWTAYLPYSYTAAMAATYLQFILILNSDGYGSGGNGNVTIGNIRTVSPTWAASGSGLSWNQAAVESGGIITTQANWVGAGSNGLGVPSGSGISVTFGDLETGNASVGLDTNQTVGTLIFNSTGDNSTGAPIQYNLTASSTAGTGAGGSLIMDNTANAAPAAINDTSNAVDQFITAPVILNSNTVATVTGAASTLFFGSAAAANTVVVGGISGVGGLTVAGAGTVRLAFADTYQGGTTVNAGATLTASADNALPSGHALVNNGTTNIQGSDNLSSLTGTGKLNLSPGGDVTSTVKLANGSGLATLGGLTIAANSVLDITNNHFILTYGAGTQATVDANIRSYIISGRAGGAWTGTTGITSSVAALPANSHYAIGYADGADHAVAGLSSGQIEVKYTLLGDADLDGSVTGSDFTALVGNLGKSGRVWDQGDFDYDGSVTGSDFTDLVGNLGKSASGAAVDIPAADYVAIDAFAAANGLSAVLPEPTSAGLLLVAGIGILARRRRNRSS